MGRPHKDLTGKRFGMLYVAECVGKQKRDKRVKGKYDKYDYMYRVICDCGNEKILSASHIINAVSCGCIHKIEDYSGRKFGRLLVKKKLSTKEYGGKASSGYLCVCDCGKEVIVSQRALKTGSTKSCGCLHSEITRNILTTHGKTNTRLYTIYCSMKSRCYNEHSPSYEIYGKRGIRVCQDWLNDFMNFYRWAITHGYEDNLSIDRIDVNGNYEPSNCRWADAKMQANNTRKTVHILYKGESKTISEIAEIENVPRTTIVSRYYKGKYTKIQEN